MQNALQLAQDRELARERARFRCVIMTGAGISIGSSMAILMVRLRRSVTGRGETRRGSRAEVRGRAGRRMAISESPLTS
jgi:hypothetical protein